MPEKRIYTLGSLFSGIQVGGFELGFEQTGKFKTVWQYEIDPFARQVLKKHWPDVPCHEDVKQIGRHNLEPIDILIGGFPCQDLSYAGRGAGIHAARSGLWWEYHRVIDELRPRIAVLENVPGLFTRGLGEVLGSLSEIGFGAEWRVVSAASQGAWHQRDRVFVVAYATGKQVGREQITTSECSVSPESFRVGAQRASANTTSRRWSECDSSLGSVSKLDAHSHAGNATDPSGERLQTVRIGRGSEQKITTSQRSSVGTPEWAGGDFGQPEPTIKRTRTQPRVRGVADGIPARVDGMSRPNRLRLLGNAVVPQVAQFVAECILDSGLLGAKE